MTPITVEYRDKPLLILLVVGLGGIVAMALSGFGWTEGSGRLLAVGVFATLAGSLMAISSLRRAAFVLLSLAALVGGVAWLLPQPDAGLPGWGHPAAMLGWLWARLAQPDLAVMAAVLTLVLFTGVWTAWWVLRRQAGLTALLPSGAIIAAAVINDPNPQLYLLTLAWLGCAVLVLARLNFVALKQRWRLRRIPRAADTGWTFGVAGLEATAFILVIAFILPPVSNQDISGFLTPGSLSQFGPFRIFSGPGAGPVEIGYSETVEPGSSLTARPHLIMVVSGDTPASYPYFRGIALGGWDGIRWYPLTSTPNLPVLTQPSLRPEQVLNRVDLPKDPRRTETVTTTFEMKVPPNQTFDTVFSAGEVQSVDQHPVKVRGLSSGPGSQAFETVDSVKLADAPKAPYTYTVHERIPNVDATSLEQSSTDYPAWVKPFTELYHNGDVPWEGRDGDIAALARKIVQDARATTSYAKAKAVETWLRTAPFQYTLDSPRTPSGQRPLDYFLFKSHTGRCVYFSTVMAVMLRTLRVPVRQMSGFTQGKNDDKTHRHLVMSTDAHSWVEVYFTGYGWIPFEPTPTFSSPSTPVRAEVAATPIPTATARLGSTAPPKPPHPQVSSPHSQGNLFFAAIASPTTLIGIAFLLLIGFGMLGMAGWLMAARDGPRIWRRLRFLGDRFGIPRAPGDTPNEYGARLASAVPEVGSQVHVLSALYTRARFRRDGLTTSDLATARRSWLQVRGSYPGLVIRAMRRRFGNGLGHPGARGPSSGPRANKNGR